MHANSIAIVERDLLLPRWDLASHLCDPWLAAYHLRTGQVHLFVWDLWSMGYWPFVQPLYQVPFFLVLGDGLASGLVSNLVVYVLLGLAGTWILVAGWRRAAPLSVALFLAFLVTSPHVLAFATVSMSELFGALMQTLVILCVLRYESAPGAGTARLLAISLTLLFFTKFNYFFLVAVPLGLHESLRRSAGWSWARRAGAVRDGVVRFLSTKTGVFLVVYAIAIFLVIKTGPFHFRLGPFPVVVGGIGASGYFVLYFLLARFFTLHSKGRIDWDALCRRDPRVRPLLIWLVVPVVVWFAIPYPNHQRDFMSLLVNVPLPATAGQSGFVYYFDVFRSQYFAGRFDWILPSAVFLIALTRFRRQSSLMRLLLLMTLLQIVAIASHQTQANRFLLPTAVLLALTAAGEVGSWVSAGRVVRTVGALAAPAILAFALSVTPAVVRGSPFRAIVFGEYVKWSELGDALEWVRERVPPHDFLAIQGLSDELSPSVMLLELGPRYGRSFPVVVNYRKLHELEGAEHVVLVAPTAAGQARKAHDRWFREFVERFEVHEAALNERIQRGEYTFRESFPLEPMEVEFRLYSRSETGDSGPGG